MLCRNCPQCKTVSVGNIGSRSWCKLSKQDTEGRHLGIQPWLDVPHPYCPLKAKIKNNLKRKV